MRPRPLLAQIVRRLVFCAAAGSITAAAHAHHSISGVYDGTRQVTIEGTIAEFRFVQPHPFVIVQVRRDGAAESWQLELDNRHELADIGFTETTLKPGDRVVVSGSPGRDGTRRLYVRRLTRPADGFEYEQAGARPRIRTVR